MQCSLAARIPRFQIDGTATAYLAPSAIQASDVVHTEDHILPHALLI